MMKNIMPMCVDIPFVVKFTKIKSIMKYSEHAL